MGLVKTKTEQDKLFLMTLLDEFGSRVIRTRKEKKVEDLGHYAIVGIEDCPCCEGKIYDLAFPEHYISFFNYLLEKRSLQ